MVMSSLRHTLGRDKPGTKEGRRSSLVLAYVRVTIYKQTLPHAELWLPLHVYMLRIV